MTTSPCEHPTRTMATRALAARALTTRALTAALALVVAGCVATGETGSTGSGTEPASATMAADGQKTNDDTVTIEPATTVAPTTHDDPADHVWDVASAVTILFDADRITTDAAQVVVDGTTATITAPGTYRLQGRLTDGRIVVDTAQAGTVQLVLDGVDLTSSSEAVIRVLDADKAAVLLADGSDNRLVRAAGADTSGGDGPTAALASSSDLTITGGGTLTVEGDHNDGISSSDGLLVAGGTLHVRAADDGLRGQDYVVVTGGEVTVEAADDAVRSEGDVTIAGGVLTLASGDDAVHADGTLTVTAGTIDVTASYEGLEAGVIVIDGGEITIVASDDGINVAGGNDGSGWADGTGDPAGRRPGGDQQGAADQFTAVSGDHRLEINGGSIVIDAGGDGIDVNGVATMTGGTVVVHGPVARMDGALDADGGFTITGGTLIAVGSAGMAQGTSASSTQPAVATSFTRTYAAGTVVQVTDTDGEVVLSLSAAKDVQSLVFSSADLVAGTSYELWIGGTASGDTGGGVHPLPTTPSGTRIGAVTAA